MAALDVLTAEEKARLLEELLTAHDGLRAEAEELATRLLQSVDQKAIAGQVSVALRSLDQELLTGRAGYQPGIGYVEETQAAIDILSETLQPYYDDLERRTAQGMPDTARQIGIGLLLGLYECRDFDRDGMLLSYADGYPSEEAAWVVQRLAKLGIQLTGHDLEELVPEWDLT